MSIVIDASSPAIVGTTGSGSLTTASFTPPAGAILVLSAAVCFTSTDPPSPTVSDSLGGTWTIQANGRNPGGLTNISSIVATRVIGSSAAMTVTSSWASSPTGSQLTVWVVTGQDTVTPIGSVLAKAPVTTTTNQTGTITTTKAGSRVFGAHLCFSAHSMSLGSNTAWPTMSGTNPTSVAGKGTAAAYLQSANTVTPGSLTMGLTADSADYYDMALVEILPATNSNIAANDNASPAADTASVRATAPAADTGASVDTATVASPVTAADTGTGLEVATIKVTGVDDPASSSEATKILSGGSILAFASDSGTFAEAVLPMAITGSDTAHAADLQQTATIGIQGPLPPGPRITRIGAT